MSAEVDEKHIRRRVQNTLPTSLFVVFLIKQRFASSGSGFPITCLFLFFFLVLRYDFPPAFGSLSCVDACTCAAVVTVTSSPSSPLLSLCSACWRRSPTPSVSFSSQSAEAEQRGDEDSERHQDGEH